MQTNFSRAILLLLFLATLGGCVSMPKPQAFNREANAEIKRIQILPMQSKPVELFIFNNPGYSFGLIGAVIAESNRDGKEDWLQETVATAHFQHSSLFREKFSAAMLERGYELKWPEEFKGESPSEKRDMYALRKQYGPVEAADAQLDLGMLFIGYAAAGAGDAQPYRPTLNMSVRLVTADGKSVLFSDLVLYHNVTNNQTAIILEPDPKFSYPDFDDLKAAGATSIDGLALAVEQTAQTIAKQL